MSIFGNPVMLGGGSGGSGNANILYGFTAPDSNIGANGAIYLKTEDTSLGDGVYASPGYVCNEAGLLGTVNGRGYYKTTADPAIVVFCKKNSNWQPHFASLVADGVSFRADSGGPWGYDVTYEIDGRTWYFSAGNHGFGSNPTVVSDYPIVNDSYTFETQADAERFLTLAGVTTTQTILIIATYAKVNGVWQDLIGTNINDIDLGGGDDSFALTAYIQSSGTQFINTGYVAKDTTKIEIVADVNTQNAAYASLFGARNAAYDYMTKAFMMYRDSTVITAYVGAKPGKATIPTMLYFGQKSVYALTKNSLSVKGADGINHYGVGFTGGTVDNDNAIYLLSFNQAGADGGSDVHCSAKLYRCRIYEGDTLVHEFLPWQENGVACLKDTVTGNIKYNAGTGSFVYGEDI